MKLKYLSIKRTSFAGARYIADFKKEPHSQRFIYYYSLQVVLGSSIKLIFIILIALILGILKEAIVCLAVFSSIRMFSGGYHSDTNFKCFLHTLAIVLGVTFISRFLINFYSLLIDAVIFAVVLYLTYKYAPCDTPNKPIISTERRNRQRLKALTLNIICFGITFFMFYHNFYVKFLPVIGLSAIFEAITITPWFNRIAPIVEINCAKPICALK